MFPRPALTWPCRSPVEMAVCSDVLSIPGVVVGSVLLLVLSSNPVWGNTTTIGPSTVGNDTNFFTGNTTTINPSTVTGNDADSNNNNGPNIAAIVAPTVTVGVLAIASAVLAWLLLVVKKKRQTEGTYRPSAEEQSGASCVAAPDVLKLPKEERLI